MKKPRLKLGHCTGGGEEKSPPPGANDVRLRQGELVWHLRINQSAAKRASATVTAKENPGCPHANAKREGSACTSRRKLYGHLDFC